MRRRPCRARRGLPGRAGAASGATPLPSLRFDSGQCTTVAPALASISRSAALGLRHVHGDQQRAGEPETRESRERPHAVTSQALLDFPARLVQVHRDWHLEFIGEAAHPDQRRVAHGVGRMRREVRGDERVAPVLVAQAHALVDVFVGGGRPACRSVGHDEPDAGAHVHFRGRARDDFRPQVHVREARRPAAQHLGDREFRSVAHVLRVHPAPLDGPDRVGAAMGPGHWFSARPRSRVMAACVCALTNPGSRTCVRPAQDFAGR